MDKFIKLLKEKGIYDTLQKSINETAAITGRADQKIINASIAEALPSIIYAHDDVDLIDAYMTCASKLIAEKLNFQVTEKLDRDMAILRLLEMASTLFEKQGDKE